MSTDGEQPPRRDEKPTMRLSAAELLAGGDASFSIAVAAMEQLDAEGTLLLRWGILTAINEQVRLAAERDALVKLLRRLLWAN
jgi:hypothetical protein